VFASLFGSGKKKNRAESSVRAKKYRQPNRRTETCCRFDISLRVGTVWHFREKNDPTHVVFATPRDSSPSCWWKWSTNRRRRRRYQIVFNGEVLLSPNNLTHLHNPKLGDFLAGIGHGRPYLDQKRGRFAVSFVNVCWFTIGMIISATKDLPA